MRKNLRGRGARSKSFLLFLRASAPVSQWWFAGALRMSETFVAGPSRDDGSVLDTGRDVWSDVVKQWGAAECSVRKESCCFCGHPFGFPMVVRRSVARCRERSSPGVLRKEFCTRPVASGEVVSGKRAGRTGAGDSQRGSRRSADAGANAEKGAGRGCASVLSACSMEGLGPYRQSRCAVADRGV